MMLKRKLATRLVLLGVMYGFIKAPPIMTTAVSGPLNSAAKSALIRLHTCEVSAHVSHRLVKFLGTDYVP